MFVGIDIGGTKTALRVVDGETIVSDSVVPTDSWQHEGLLADPRSVDALLALFARHLADPAQAWLAVGAHGCDSPAQLAELQLALEGRFAGAVGVYNDAQLLGPAAGRPDAVALIAGTGAIAVGHDRTGAVITSGGHGWLLTDPGSAPALARDGVRAVLARADRHGDVELLGEKFLAALDVANVNELAYEFSRTASMQSWARLGPLVFEAADEGSEDAAAVIDAAGAELAELVLGVLRKGAHATAVIAAGGVVTNQPRLENSIRAHLAETAPELIVELLGVPPVVGAIELARALQHSATPPSAAAQTMTAQTMTAQMITVQTMTAQTATTPADRGPAAEGGRVMTGRLSFGTAIRQQPESLRRALRSIRESLRAAQLAPWRRGETVAVLAMGASHHSAHALFAALTAAGVRCVTLTASSLDDAAPGFRPGDHHLIVSESGRSVEPIRAAGRLGAGRRIGVTNYPDAPLAAVLDATVDLGGFDDSPVYTVGYTATLLAYSELLRATGHAELAVDEDALPALIAEALDKYGAIAPMLAEHLSGVTSIDCVGGGYSVSSAGESALLLRESVRIPATAYDTSEYLHGPMESGHAGTGLILFGDDVERALIASQLAAGVKVILVTALPARRTGLAAHRNLRVVELPAGAVRFARAIIEIVVIQLVVEEMAALKPYSIGDFLYPQGDTKVGEEG